MELRRAARLFALLNMSIFDGYVSVFDSKFFYNRYDSLAGNELGRKVGGYTVEEFLAPPR